MRPNILFADDNCDICELVQHQLHAAGFRVSTADNAADVLRLVRTERFDALIFDYWMPDVTGIELCRRIRTFDQSTPILIRSEEHTSELQSQSNLVCRLLLEKKKKKI